MNNIRNARTTHPRKAQRRASAMENFTVDRKRMGESDYMARRQQEWIALGGTAEAFPNVMQRLYA